MSERGLGWLAREDKVEVKTVNGPEMTVVK